MQLKDPALFRKLCFVDGRWHRAQETFSVKDPTTQATIGEVVNCDETLLNQAVKSAHVAQPLWRNLAAPKRARFLRKWGDLILENKQDLATIIVREQGKPLAEALAEIAYASSFVYWFADEALRAYGDVIPSPSSSRRSFVLKQPVGVVAAITPWNFPSAMITRKCAPALAAGCTVVLKPAEQTPFSALALALLAQKAGFPKGVINVITSNNPGIIGAKLVGHELVNKITFTGSTQVGKTIMKGAAQTLKRVSLELGGNAPFIVFEDADLDLAAEGAMACKFRNSGQTCISANRFYVHTAVHDAFVEKLTEKVKNLTVGDGLKEGMTQGPLIDQAGFEKVEVHIADAVVKGATVLMGGKQHALGGTFFEPTVITKVTDTMLMTQEETFGPVIGIQSFETEADVIAQANATPYGLAAYFYSRDFARIWRVAEALECGMVGINESRISEASAPFGGIKQSGIGREGSKHGLDAFLEIKHVSMGVA